MKENTSQNSYKMMYTEEGKSTQQGTTHRTEGVGGVIWSCGEEKIIL